MKFAHLPESLIQSNYPDFKIPPLWQVLYQEAIRGNHLIFDKKECEAFEAERTGYKFSWEEMMTEEIEDIISHLASCADLREMMDIIDSHDRDVRKILYFLYIELLVIWKHYLKSQMN